MQQAHLIKRQVLERECPGHDVWDSRVWVWACERHHRQFDHARTLRLPRENIPSSTEVAAAELGLTWWLDREYGP